MNTSFEIEPNQEIRNTVCLFTSTSGNLSVDCNERFLFAVTIMTLRFQTKIYWLVRCKSGKMHFVQINPDDEVIDSPSIGWNQ